MSFYHNDVLDGIGDVAFSRLETVNHPRRYQSGSSVTGSVNMAGDGETNQGHQPITAAFCNSVKARICKPAAGPGIRWGPDGGM